MGITRRMVFLVWLGIILLLAGTYVNLNISIFIIYNSALFILLMLDYKISPGSDSFEVERVYDDIFEIGKEKEILIKVKNRSSRNVHMQLKDTVPDEMKQGSALVSLICHPLKHEYCSYHVRPIKRGSFSFGSIYVRYHGTLGLCTKSFEEKCRQDVPVYPDLHPMKKYHLLSRSRLLQTDDSSAHKMYGIGTDFQYLRDYTTDDEYRKINWNATARSHKLITGVYDVEKSQTVIICIDTGRNMMSVSEGLSRLDHSIQSALVLAQVAIDKGDRVGVVIFGNDVKLFLKPDKGPAQLNKILQAVYSLQADYYESNFNELISYLETYQRKRSFLCIFSHTGDEETCRDLASSLSPLVKKHAVLMVSILNPGLTKILDFDVKSPHDAYTKAASAYRLNTEHNASTIMSRLGISNIMVKPDQLTPETVNRYTAMKKAMKIS